MLMCNVIANFCRKIYFSLSRRDVSRMTATLLLFFCCSGCASPQDRAISQVNTIANRCENMLQDDGSVNERDPWGEKIQWTLRKKY